MPREWEQQLYEKELDFKIEWLSKLTNEQTFKDMRQKMVDIWKNVRRSLDTSLPCIYMRYAYRQIAEDINQVALDTNLKAMEEAKNMVQRAYKRIEKYKKSDSKIIEKIEEEKKKEERFTIKN